MPFPNVPAHLTAKMDSCIKKVQSDSGISKARAIATCFNSVVKELAEDNDGVLSYLYVPVIAELAAQYAEPDIRSQQLKTRRSFIETVRMAYSKAIDQLIDGGFMDAEQKELFETDLREHVLTIGADRTVTAAEEAEEPTEEVEKEEPMDKDNARARRTKKRADERAAEEKDHLPFSSAVEEFQPFGGAESWDDLDSYLEAEDQKDAVRIATFEFERLQTNVLNNNEHSLSEKATKIAALADGLTARSDDIQEKEEDQEKIGWIEKIRSTLKQGPPSKTVDGKRLAASDFASVGNASKPATWKLPLGTSSGAPNEGRIRDAITAMQPGGFRGQRVKLTAPKASVVRKISGAINRLSASADVKKRLRARLSKVKAAENSGFRIFKDADGIWRWFGWATNKWRDKDSDADPVHGGEILTEAAHKEFIAWVDKNPTRRMPALWPWHTKEAAHEMRADWLDYANGFVCVSGPLGEEEAKAISRVADQYDLGMSHGFYALDRDQEHGHILKYRTFEVSYLPLQNAANPWTDFVTIEKEVESMGFSDDKRAMLALLAGEEFAEEVEQETEAKADLLEQAGVDSKENGKEPADEAAEEAAPAEEAEEAEAESAESADDETEAEEAESEEKEVEFLPREEAVTAFTLMTDMLVSLDDKLTALSVTDAEKIEDAVEKTPRASLAEIIAQRASQSEETKEDGRSSLAKSGPKEAEANEDAITGISLVDNLMKMNASRAQALRQ